MNSFYGGTQGASFVIVKRFDAISVPSNTTYRLHYYATDGNNNIYIYRLGDSYIPIIRNEVNKNWYKWQGQLDNGLSFWPLGEHSDWVHGISVIDLDALGISQNDPRLKYQNSFDKISENEQYATFVPQSFNPIKNGSIPLVESPTVSSASFFLQYAEGMVECFERGIETNAEVGFGEYVLIDSSNYPGVAEGDFDNGKIFRRGLNYVKSDTNPLAGAEYVGKILGPVGEAKPVRLKDLDDVLTVPDKHSGTYEANGFSYAQFTKYVREKSDAEVSTLLDGDVYKKLNDFFIHTTKIGVEDECITNKVYNIFTEVVVEDPVEYFIEHYFSPGLIGKYLLVKEANGSFAADTMYIVKPEKTNAADMSGTGGSDIKAGSWLMPDGTRQYEDVVDYGYATVRDSATGQIIETQIGFKFPYNVIDIDVKHENAYYNRNDYDSDGYHYRSDFENLHLLERTDDYKHPFYQQYKIHIPNGKHGKDVVNIKDIPEAWLNLRTNQLKVIASIDGTSKTGYTTQQSIDDYNAGIYGQGDLDQLNYAFTEDTRVWYIRTGSTSPYVFKECNGEDNTPLLNKYKDEYHNTDLVENTYYADHEYPYNIYQVVSGKGKTSVTAYATQFLTAETNLELYEPITIVVDTTVNPPQYPTYPITQIVVNNYIQIDKDGTPYWIPYDETIIDSAYPDKNLIVTYTNYERFAEGEMASYYFGPITEFKEVSLQQNGQLDIYFAHRDDVSKQLQWIDKIDSLNQRDLLFYYCNNHTNAAKISKDGLQKIEYMYVQNGIEPVQQTVLAQEITDAAQRIDITKRYYLNDVVYRYLGSSWQAETLTDHHYRYKINDPAEGETDRKIDWYRYNGTEWVQLISESETPGSINLYNYFNMTSIIAEYTLDSNIDTYFATLVYDEDRPIQMYRFKFDLSNEGTGDQRLHVKFNNQDNESVVSLPLNYIVETAFTDQSVLIDNSKEWGANKPAPNHILVLYAAQSKQGNLSYPRKDGTMSNKWVDIGAATPKTINATFRVGAYMDYADLATNKPPEELFASYGADAKDFAGWQIMCGDDVFMYDYNSHAWAGVTSFKNTLAAKKRVYVDSDPNHAFGSRDGSYSYPYATIKDAMKYSNGCRELEIYLKTTADYTNSYGFTKLKWLHVSKDPAAENSLPAPTDGAPSYVRYYRPEGSMNDQGDILQDSAEEWYHYNGSEWELISSGVNNVDNTPIPSQTLNGQYYFCNNKLYQCTTITGLSGGINNYYWTNNDIENINYTYTQLTITGNNTTLRFYITPQTNIITALNNNERIIISNFDLVFPFYTYLINVVFRNCKIGGVRDDDIFGENFYEYQFTTPLSSSSVRNNLELYNSRLMINNISEEYGGMPNCCYVEENQHTGELTKTYIGLSIQLDNCSYLEITNQSILEKDTETQPGKILYNNKYGYTFYVNTNSKLVLNEDIYLPYLPYDTETATKRNLAIYFDRSSDVVTDKTKKIILYLEKTDYERLENKKKLDPNIAYIVTYDKTTNS